METPPQSEFDPRYYLQNLNYNSNKNVHFDYENDPIALMKRDCLKYPMISEEEAMQCFDLRDVGMRAEELLLDQNLTKEKIAQLQKDVLKGKMASDVLFLSNLRLVLYSAKSFPMQNVETLLDYFQEGCIRLLRCVDEFDQNQGMEFSDYAVHRIKNAIRLKAENAENLIYLPRGVRNAIKSIRIARAKSARNSSLQSMQELADISSMTPKAVAELLEIDQLNHWENLDVPVYTQAHGDDVLLGETLVPPDSDEAYNQVIADIRAEKIMSEAKKILTDLEYEIFKEKSENPDITYVMIAEKYNMGKDKAEDMHHRSLSKLRHPVCGIKKLIN